MADTVHYRLERMLPELDDLEKRGLFSKQEIAEIVKRRRKFEYRLKRPSPLKQDFLDYIEYEIQLDSLRRLRKKGDQNHKKRSETSHSDFSGVARIIDIYRLAVSRFKADLDLWFRYLEFCRTHRNGRMKKVLAQVIRFHPKVPGIWIYAAAWEFDQNLNVVSARALMQNGLRVCPSSEELWVEYLRMELTYLNKLKARKVALGEGKGSLVRAQVGKDDEQWKNDNKDLYLAIKDDGEARESQDSDNVDAKNNVTDQFQLQGLNVLKTIYEGAVEAIPSSFDLRKRLFDILEAVDLGHTDDVRKKILNDLRFRFSMDPNYWDWLARLEFKSSNSELSVRLSNSIKVYEEAIQTVRSPTMFKLYSKFLIDATEQELIPLSNNASCLSQLMTVYERATKLNSIDSELACDYVMLYLKLGRSNEARKIATSLCSRKMPNSTSLCISKAALDFRNLTKEFAGVNKENAASIFDFVSDLLSRAPVSEVVELWKMAFKQFANDKKYTRKLVDMAYTVIAKQGGVDDGFSLPAMIINFVIQKDGINEARTLYKRFLALPNPGLPLYKCCIELEENLAFVGDADSLVNVRKLYDSTLAKYKENTALWKAYYDLELKVGTAETSTGVYWNARKRLGNLSEFLISTDTA